MVFTDLWFFCATTPKDEDWVIKEQVAGHYLCVWLYGFACWSDGTFCVDLWESFPDHIIVVFFTFLYNKA